MINTKSKTTRCGRGNHEPKSAKCLMTLEKANKLGKIKLIKKEK